MWRWRIPGGAQRIRQVRGLSDSLSFHQIAVSKAVKRVFSPRLEQRLHDWGTKLGRSGRLSQASFLRWQQALTHLIPFGGASEGNHVTIYRDGDDAFGAMWDAVKQAKYRIRWETYELALDPVGLRTIELLTEAAQRGVEVTLIYDDFGSHALPEDVLRHLKQAGADVVIYNYISWQYLFSPQKYQERRHQLFRNHRKVLIVDDEVGFCGSVNITQEYCGPSSGGTGEFRDTHAKIIGPAIHDLTVGFLHSLRQAHLAQSGPLPVYADTADPDDEHEEDDHPPKTVDMVQSASSVFRTRMHDLWERLKHPSSSSPSSSKTLDVDPELVNVDTVPPLDDGIFVQVLQSARRRHKRFIQTGLRIALDNAQDEVFITNPYFLPGWRLKRAILNAAKRGVDVRVLTAGKSDVPVVQMASQHIFSSFLQAGVRVYEMQDKVLHAKTVTMDGIYSSVGSFNFDDWSERRNLETNITMLDPEPAHVIRDHFMQDLPMAKEISMESLEERNFAQRALHWLAYQTTRIPKFFEDPTQEINLNASISTPAEFSPHADAIGDTRPSSVSDHPPSVPLVSITRSRKSPVFIVPQSPPDKERSTSSCPPSEESSVKMTASERL